MKRFLIGFMTLLAASEVAAGQPFVGGATWFSVLPSGQLIVIDGRVYCWRTAGERNGKRPELPESASATWVSHIDDGGSPNAAAAKEDQKKHFLTLRARQGAEKFLATDEKGQAIAVPEAKDRSLWLVINYPVAAIHKDDTVWHFQFRAADADEKKNYLGLGEKPITIKDDRDRDQQFYPLILTDKEHAARFEYNDYSGK
jgi:hypothetical protein